MHAGSQELARDVASYILQLEEGLKMKIVFLLSGYGEMKEMPSGKENNEEQLVILPLLYTNFLTNL
jgi:hypothetical protein